MRDAIVEIHCPFCGCVHTVEVNEDAYYDWQDGMLIQNAMPDLTPTEREQLISKLCPKCQESVFGVEEDECDYEVGFDPYMGCFTDDCYGSHLFFEPCVFGPDARNLCNMENLAIFSTKSLCNITTCNIPIPVLY